MFKIKRVYDPPETSDGRRVLVDLFWPRGISKEKARVDDWLKEKALSTGLRKWFSHDPAKWAEFQRRYAAELKDKRVVLDTLKAEEEGHGNPPLRDERRRAQPGRRPQGAPRVLATKNSSHIFKSDTLRPVCGSE